jgi:Fe2+ transport system protein FeoA
MLLLSEAESGRSYRVSGVFERERDLLEFLEARGIRPGAKLMLLERNYDKTISIRAGARKLVLGRPAADKVWVSPLSSSSS